MYLIHPRRCTVGMSLQNGLSLRTNTVPVSGGRKGPKTMGPYTLTSDKLRALAGLATASQRATMGDVYLAGMW